MFLLTVSISISEEYCTEIRLLNGYEKLNDAGLDSTNNWWAITMPFSNKYRLHVNGQESDVYDFVTTPIFSFDGLNYAAWGDAGATKYLIMKDSLSPISCTNFGEIVFSGSSEKIVYSYFNSNLETIINNEKHFEVIGRSSKIFTNYNGDRIAFSISRGNYKSMIINGIESTTFDEIIPIGFWWDNSFLYAGSNGGLWEVYKNNKSISEKYSDITEVRINIKGDVAAFVGRSSDGWFNAILLSDDYFEPLISQTYESISDLALHPFSPMYAFNAKMYDQYYVVFNSTEYTSYRTSMPPKFSWNGDELYFFACSELNCYINVNGKRLKLIYGANFDLTYARAPESDTYAFCSNSNLYMNFISKRDARAGLIVDMTTIPRYNRFNDSYEALGVINDRLYLLTCKVPRNSFE